MRFKIILLVFLCQNSLSFGQDGAFAGYYFSIQLVPHQPLDPNDSIVSVEFYKNIESLNPSTVNTSCSMGLLKYDLGAGFFSLSEGCTFIGSSPKTITPPTLFMAVRIQRNNMDGSVVHFVKWIPIVFDGPMKNFAQIALSEVDLNPYLNIPSESIALKVVSEKTVEIVDQTTLETQPKHETVIQFE